MFPNIPSPFRRLLSIRRTELVLDPAMPLRSEAGSGDHHRLRAMRQPI
jgi:hypothetical protein